VDEALTIPPERLLRVLLLQAFYSVRSQKQVVEQLDYNLLFRWFVGLSLDEEVWDETVFTKNRERLIEGGQHQLVHLASIAGSDRGDVPNKMKQ